MIEMKDISEIVETTYKEETNAYLKEGWTLIDTCIQDHGVPGQKRRSNNVLFRLVERIRRNSLS